jgi:hypothetical protein
MFCWHHRLQLVCTYAEFQFTSDFDIGENASTVVSSEDAQLDLGAWQQNFREVNEKLRRQFYFL